MDKYLDHLFTHRILSESSEEPNYNSIRITQKGGNPNNKKDILKHTATGSFPPLYIAPKNVKKEEDPDKTRAFAQTSKTAVSIKDIMQERRGEQKPFISI